MHKTGCSAAPSCLPFGFSSRQEGNGHTNKYRQYFLKNQNKCHKVQGAKFSLSRVCFSFIQVYVLTMEGTAPLRKINFCCRLGIASLVSITWRVYNSLNLAMRQNHINHHQHRGVRLALTSPKNPTWNGKSAQDPLRVGRFSMKALYRSFLKKHLVSARCESCACTKESVGLFEGFEH